MTGTPAAERAREGPAKPAYWHRFPDIPWHEMRTRIVAASDGVELTVVEAGSVSAPVVILVAPPSTPMLLLVPLCKVLARSCHVVSWEPRGAGYLEATDGTGQVDCSRRRSAEDLLDIAAALSLGRYHVVTLCDGAHIAIEAHRAGGGGSLLTASLVGASGLSPVKKRKFFAGTLLPMLKRALADGRDEARDFLDALRDLSVRSDFPPAERAAYDLFLLNFRDPEAAARFIHSTESFEACPAGEADYAQACQAGYEYLLDTVPVMLCHATDDEIVPCEMIQETVARLGRAKLVLYPGGRHFLSFTRPEHLGGDIANFIRIAGEERQA